MGNLKGKVALVTGAGSEKGIGHSTAVYLAREGAAVAVADITASSQVIESVVAEIKQNGGRAMGVTADVTSEQQVNQMVEKVMAEFHQVDILINSHGIQGPTKTIVAEYPLRDWDKVLGINLTGTFLCCKAVSREMIKRNKGGKIVILASRAGKIGRPGHAAYSASKFGVIGLTQSLALELAPYGINVNSVCPNLLPTGLSRGDELDELVKKKGISYTEAGDIAFADVIKTIPLQRLGKVEDIAEAILFLVSSSSSYITGQALNVNGGALMY